MKFKSEVQLEALNNATSDTDKFLVSDSSTVKYRTGAEVRSDIGAGTVTSVSGTGTVSGLTLTGTVTASGSLTLGGTLSLTAANVNAVGTITNSTSGNAATATVLQTTRSISLGTAVTSTATNFNGSANITIPVTGVSEAYLTWGGRNLSGSYAPIDAALMPELGANRLAFTPASAMIVEYSQDGGTTWLPYSLSDASKINLLNGNASTIQVGGGGYPAGTNYTNYLVRVTINTAGQIYTALNKFIVYVSTNGSTGAYCTIDARTQSDYLAGINTWTTFANQAPVAGWSGYNVINTSNITTFGNTPASQFGQVRFTFGQTGYSTSYTGLQIIKLLGFGGVGWQTPSTLAATGQMYTYDYLKNITFPAAVTATSFIGPLTGNATTATTLQTARAINGTSFNGSADITTANWGTARTITIGNTGKSVNGGANVSWTLAEIGAQAALTNPITGTGTANYISKFTGTTSLGNSLIYDNGTNVGIGTTTLVSKLTVGGSSGAVATPTAITLDSTYRTGTLSFDSLKLYLYKSATETYGFGVGPASDLSYWAGTTSTGTHAFYTSQTERMRIATNGNMGIGTTNPLYKLDIADGTALPTLRLSNPGGGGYGGGGNIIFEGGGTDYVSGNISWKNGALTRAAVNYAAATRIMTLTSENYIHLNIGGTNMVAVDTNGNLGVGLGGTYPAAAHKIQANGRIATVTPYGDFTALETVSGNGFRWALSNNATFSLQKTTNGFASIAATPIVIHQSNNVGINHTAPSARLDVYKGSQSDTITRANASAYIYGADVGLAIGQGAANPWGTWLQSMRASDNVAFPLLLNPAGGNVGIGTLGPSYPLHVTTQVSSISIYANYDIVAYSDQSVKENVRPIENALGRVIESRGVLYDRIDSGDKNNIGFIAQELEVAFPELVVTNEDGTKAVKYQNAVAVLFEAIKEQQKQIDEIKTILNGLTN